MLSDLQNPWTWISIDGRIRTFLKIWRHNVSLHLDRHVEKHNLHVSCFRRKWSFCLAAMLAKNDSHGHQTSIVQLQVAPCTQVWFSLLCRDLACRWLELEDFRGFACFYFFCQHPSKNSKISDVFSDPPTNGKIKWWEVFIWNQPLGTPRKHQKAQKHRRTKSLVATGWFRVSPLSTHQGVRKTLGFWWFFKRKKTSTKHVSQDPFPSLDLEKW